MYIYNMHSISTANDIYVWSASLSLKHTNTVNYNLIPIYVTNSPDHNLTPTKFARLDFENVGGYFSGKGNSQGESLNDLEILDTVKFLAFLVTRGNRESISAECQIFYPVAFFLGALNGDFHSDLPLGGYNKPLDCSTRQALTPIRCSRLPRCGKMWEIEVEGLSGTS